MFRLLLIAPTIFIALFTLANDSFHELPFDYRTHQPIAQLQVNGKSSAPFLFDTGASMNAIDEKLAQKLGIVSQGRQTLSGGGEASVRSSYAQSLTFAAKTLRWEQQRAAILPLGYPDRKHFAGFIGAPVLMRYSVQFDFGKRVLRFFSPRAYKPRRNAVILPFELQENLPVVRALVDAGAGPNEALLMLDTGAATFIDLNRPFVDAHHLVKAISGGEAEDRSAAIGGTAPFVYGTGKRVVVGSLTFNQPRLGLSRAKQGSSSRSERDGIIGNHLMEQFTVTFDYSTQTVSFER